MRQERSAREAVEGRVTPEVEALLAAVRRPGEGGSPASRAALDAYREARETGALEARGRWWRSRRRDDWRPARRWCGVLPVRVAFASLAATVTLGGVALAAGTGVVPVPFGGGGSGGGGGSDGGSGGGARPGSSASATPGGERGEGVGGGVPGRPSVGVTSPSVPVSPSRAGGRDEVAHCGTYLASRGRGDERGAAFQRLAADAARAGVTVEAYCEGVTPGKGASAKAPTASEAAKDAKRVAPGRGGGPGRDAGRRP